MRRELREQSEFMRLLTLDGWYCYKVKASRKGVPDIEGIKNDVSVKFESKAEGGVLSPMQIRFRRIYSNTYLVIKKGRIFKYYGKSDLKIKSNRVLYGGHYEN